MKNEEIPENFDTVKTKDLLSGYKQNRIKKYRYCKSNRYFLNCFRTCFKIWKFKKIYLCFSCTTIFLFIRICFTQKDNKKFIVKKIKTIYIPYIIVSIISIAVYFFVGKYVSNNINTNIVYNFIRNVIC